MERRGMLLRTTLDVSEIVEKVEGVRFVRAAYRPCMTMPEFPFDFVVPEKEMMAEFWLAEGETVASVLNYHYGRKAWLVDPEPSITPADVAG